MIIPKYKVPSVLSIAGMDSTCGAGQQADIKTISSLGVYATAALTALPIQNTRGVKNIFSIPTVAVAEQIDVVLEDIYPNAIKIGMVHTSELVSIIAERLSKNRAIPVVFDPVMVATSGHKLIEDETIEAIKKVLFPLATLITPNMDEASVLVEFPVENLDDMYRAGRIIMETGCQSLLLKGGHQKGERLTSLFFQKDCSVQEYSYQKYETNNTHGSGCTLSSAIASYLALGFELSEAVQKGQDYVHEAIKEGAYLAIGKGNGPLNHFFNPQKLVKYVLE